MQTKEITRTTIRMPKKLYKKVLEQKKLRPHMSINSLLIEAITNDLESKKVGNNG